MTRPLVIKVALLVTLLILGSILLSVRLLNTPASIVTVDVKGVVKEQALGLSRKELTPSQQEKAVSQVVGQLQQHLNTFAIQNKVIIVQKGVVFGVEDQTEAFKAFLKHALTEAESHE